MLGNNFKKIISDEILVDIPGKEYKILIGNKCINDVGNIIKAYLNREDKSMKVAVITDRNVNKKYGKTALESLAASGFKTYCVSIPAGERSKSPLMLEKLYEQLLSFGITRSDLIIALGGGVVGDLAGYAAATLLRGIPFIQIPTTLLAQVDSSVGGKVAINLSQGKNLVGSFYQPKLVIIDTNCLKSLENSDFSDGVSEVLKYGMIRDGDLFNLLCSCKSRKDIQKNIADIIFRCCTIKSEIIKQDERDESLRMILNFGHTFGHIYEKAYNYKGVTHGQAVAAGMCLALKVGCALGYKNEALLSKLIEVLEINDLPTYISMPSEAESLNNIIAVDKKGKGDKITFILIEELGTAVLKEMDKKDLVAIVERIL